MGICSNFTGPTGAGRIFSLTTSRTPQLGKLDTSVNNKQRCTLYFRCRKVRSFHHMGITLYTPGCTMKAYK